MDKNAIKKYAVWARRELISRVTQKALQYGITDKEIKPADAASVNGIVLTVQEKQERQALIAKINAEGFEQVMEEVAYTWFNRFSALRFMEVNGYLPTHVRVFTDKENNFKPQIMTEAIHLDIDRLDMEKVYALKEANDNDALFKYLIITQCNALNAILPGMFQKIEDYTELLFPDNLLREGSVIEQMIALIPEDDWKDAVQIIGWLYQYYNTEKKDEVFAALKNKVKISKESIPAATQLFTPDWIVRYMVENSLGRLWVEGHPNEELKSNWKYYLEEAEQEPDVQVQLAEIRKEYAALKPEDIRCIDPCCGSGHILDYLFDVLVQIYESYGYTAREAAASIVEKNIYGLDIDDRAAQLANFAVMMKARQYDRRFFSRGIQPQVHAIVESNHVDAYTMDYFANGDAKLKKAIKTIIDELYDAKEYGSIINVTQQDWEALYARFEEIRGDINISREAAMNELMPLVRLAQALAQKYDVVVTNPPYMGASNMNSKLNQFIKMFYSDSKSDLFATFIEKGNTMVKPFGFNCMVTMQSWMFLSSFEKMRKKILKTRTITNLMHMDNMVMGIAFGTAVTLFRNCVIQMYKGTYNQIKFIDIVKNTPIQFPNYANRFAQISSDNFSKIPGSPIAYWIDENFFDVFTRKKLRDISIARRGLETGNNDKYIRYWFEVYANDIDYECTDIAKFVKKWLPHNKGGNFRTWFGNDDLVVWFENDGKDIRKSGTLNGYDVFLKEGITWTALTSSKNSFRYTYPGHTFDSNKGPLIVDNGENIIYYLLAFFNSPVAQSMMKVLNPTMSLQNGDMDKLPIIISKDRKAYITELSEENVTLSKIDWDSFETSHGFKKHPLLNDGTTIKESFEEWKATAQKRFDKVKSNEEILNHEFISIYGQDTMSAFISEDEVCIQTAKKNREIKSLISYAVGCMFGRYSLDVSGLAYAGGDWDASKYQSFPADTDNILPICDDEYFDDDLTGLFVKFIATVYGEAALDENLQFIADALGGKGSPKEVIRRYFLNDFYKDHCKTYQKNPIYWLFDSGKKNGFKCLIYMHRYQPDTIARIRTDYVHEQQGRYRTAIDDLEQRIESASTSERVKLNKQLKKLQGQSEEIHEYEEKIHHLADQYIPIDLDDGVKVNYAKFQDVLAKIK